MVNEKIVERFKEKLEGFRKKILDISKRNPLINFKPRSYSIEISKLNSAKILNKITNDEKESYMPLFFEQEDEHEENEKHLLQIKNDNNNLKALRNLEKRANEYFVETGINITFLAIGFLSWKESEASEIGLNAPLLLIPAKLIRYPSKSGYRLEFIDSSIKNNTSLSKKVYFERGISLPNIEKYIGSEAQIEDYFKAIEEKCSSIEGWFLNQDICYLSCFNMNKLSIYEDLEPDIWCRDLKIKEKIFLNKNIMALFSSIPSVQIDSKVDSDALNNVHHVIDVDKSQRKALNKINLGKSLIIQGPPGTGKSQTIVNMIAAAVGNNKTVLFVTEKLVALEVVKNKIDNIGLGEIVLELHEDKTDRNDFFEELNKVINKEKYIPYTSSKEELNKMKRLREELDNYDKSMITEVKDTGITPSEGVKEIIRLKERLVNINFDSLDIEEIGFWSKEKFDNIKDKFKEYCILIQKNGNPQKSPFYECLSKSYLTQTDFLEFKEKLKIFSLRMKSFLSNYDEYLKKGMPKIKTLLEAEKMLVTIKLLEKGFIKEGYRYSSKLWMKKEGIISILKDGLSYSQEFAKYDQKFKKEWMFKDSKDYEYCKKILNKYKNKWWRKFARKYRNTHSYIKDMYIINETKSDEEYIKDICEIMEVKNRKEMLLERYRDIALEVIDNWSDNWVDKVENWNEFQQVYNNIERINIAVKKKKVIPEIFSVIDGYGNLYYTGSRLDSLNSIIEEIKKLAKYVQEKTSFSSKRCKKEGKFETTLWYYDFTKLTDLLKQWIDQSDDFKFVIQYNKLSKYLIEHNLEPILRFIINNEMTAGDMVDCLDMSRYRAILDRAKTQFGGIVEFDAIKYDKKIEMIKRYEESEMRYNRDLVLEKMSKKIQDYKLREVKKIIENFHAKRRRSIRKAFVDYGEEIQEIKPVIMMSPLSIPKYIAPNSINFDLVIFDEASQITPEEAIGAILRGTQTIVVGDDKQLPPTNFFKAIIAESEEEVDLQTEYESVLDWFLGRGYNKHMLKWHYRSKHESLIFVSNKEFYNSNLIITPSPYYESKELGLKFNHVPKSVFDRGGTATNKIEAKAIIEKAMEHVEKKPEESLGIVAFSKAQKEKIEEQLAISLKKNPSFRDFFESEKKFFVKNLETVQGDERDVIFISVGYGKDSFGKLTANFGPINRKGGEKRLNVIMTRAKSRCEIFSNFRYTDLEDILSATKNRNKSVEIFCNYLQYAENRQLSDLILRETQRGFDSPFEIDVYKEIEKMGYKAVSQVGTHGFFIDLAISCPNRPGKYALGIECDGASYHSSGWARNRDRIRQKILENHGWEIYRIWSTDWFSRRDDQIKKLKDKIENAIRFRCSDS